MFYIVRLHDAFSIGKIYIKLIISLICSGVNPVMAEMVSTGKPAR